MTIQPASTIKIFYCHAPEDNALQVELEAHLSPLRKIRHITTWFDARDILAGADREQEIETHLDDANIILILVSSYFFSSDYWYNIAMQRALKRHRDGTARVIPILLRPVLWEDTSIGALRVLPTGKKPVTLWVDRDEAWEEVASGIRETVRQLLPTQILSPKEIDILAPAQANQAGQPPVVPPPPVHSPKETRVLPPAQPGQQGQPPVPTVLAPPVYSPKETRVLPPAPQPGQQGQPPAVLPPPISSHPLRLSTLFARRKPLLLSGLTVVAVFILIFISIHIIFPTPKSDGKTPGGRSSTSTPFSPTHSPLTSTAQPTTPATAAPSSQLLNTTTVSNLKKKWAFQTKGPVDFSPVEADGIIYASSGNNGSNGGYLYALDAASGQQKWPPFVMGGSPSSPVVVGSFVYIASSDGDLYAVSTSSGKSAWSVSTQVIYNKPAAPLVTGGIVYMTASDGKLHALDATSGSPKWTFPSTSPISNFFKISSFTVVGGVVYVGFIGGSLYALDAASGNMKWTAPAKAGSQDSAQPILFAVTNSTVYTGVELSNPNLYAIEIATGKVTGSAEVGGQVNSNPTSLTVANTIVYAGSSDGAVYAFDATLAQQKWRWTFPTAGNEIVSLTAVNDIAYIAGTNNGGLYAINTTSGQTKWSLLTGTGSLAIVNGVVYVGLSGGELDALDAVSGQQKWSSSTGGAINASPIVGNNSVYACLSADVGLSTLYAFALS